VDTLGRWMAHRLAELMQTAENDEEAKAEATDLILRLWEHRSDWPEGWPPPKTESVRRALEPVSPFPAERDEDEDGSDPWLRRVPRLTRLQEEEREVWRDLALLDLDLGVELEGIGMVGDDLDEEERALFAALRVGREAAQRHFSEELGDADSPAARVELGRRKLRALARKRGRLFSGAVEESLEQNSVEDCV
jgi:hypothetical protein